MDDRFVSLAAIITASCEPSVAVGPQRDIVPAVPSVSSTPRAGSFEITRADIATELALVRLAALEAFERASADLLELLARDVLLRELTIAPADINALAARALAAFAESEPIGLAVSPSDVELLRASLPVRSDATLEPGDLAIEVRDGSVLSQFAFRVREAVAIARGRAS